jgi:polysaccharide export outer membrane protein
MNGDVRRRTSLAGALMLACASASAGQTAAAPLPPLPPPPAAQQAVPAVSAEQASYIVGSQDVLVITSYDDPALTGKFTVEIDGTFSYPFVGRVRVGGLTLRDVEGALKKALIDMGFFKEPQLTVAIETYRSQKIYIVGEVRTPGSYPLSGDMRLVEALALAGSTTATASGEAVIVRATADAVVLDPNRLPPASANPAPGAAGDPDKVIRVDLRELENGDLSQNMRLRNGDTIFVLRAESVYVFGQVKSPGAYPLRQKNTTVLQALSLAGGVTDRGSMGRIQIVRIVDGKKLEVDAELTDFVLPRDTIIVPERFF